MIYFYFLCKNDGLPVYIGMTECAKQRFKGHLVKSHKETSIDLKKWIDPSIKMVVFYCVESCFDYRDIENYLINKAGEKYRLLNKFYKNKSKSYSDALRFFNESVLSFSAIEERLGIKYVLNKFDVPQKKYSRVTLELSQEENDLLNLIAKKQGRTASNLARKYIVDGLSKDEQKPENK